MDSVAGFKTLSPREFADTIAKASDCEAYLDCLVLIDDVVCGLVPNSPPPRFPEVGKVIEYVEEIASRFRHKKLRQNILVNLSVAKSFRQELDQMGEQRMAVAKLGTAVLLFQEKILDQYTVIARAYQFGSEKDLPEVEDDVYAIASQVQKWFARLGEKSREFWRVCTEYLQERPTFTFVELQVYSGISVASLKSMHNNSYRAIKREGSPNPLTAEWDDALQRNTYRMDPKVCEVILHLTHGDKPGGTAKS